jgi:hypothetical protein
VTDSSIFNPKNLPSFDPQRGRNVPFVPSQGRVGTPTNNPVIPAHRDAVITPLMPRPDSAPKQRG